MKKTLMLFFAFVLTSGILISCQNASFAQSASNKANNAPYISASLKPCIAKYKNGDYIGTIQDITALLEKEPNNMYAKYYLALSYTRLGYREKAESLYKEVAEDSSNLALQYYSQKAVDCLNDPEGEACKPKPKTQSAVAQKRPAQSKPQMQNVANKKQNQEPVSDITQFIMSGQQIHPAAMDKITRERMERKIQQEEYLRKQQEQDSKLKSDATNALPTNEEIASALNTLSKIGMNPYQINPLMTQNTQFNQFANPFMTNMLLGNNSNTNSDFAKMFLYSQLMQPQNNLLNYGI